MDKHFVLSKIKDYEAHLDNVAPLMESDDQLIMNELIREINNTCHVKIRGFSDLCDSYIKGAGSIIAKHINCFHSHLIRSALVFHLVGSKKHECGRVNGCEQIIWNLYNEYRNSVTFVDNSIMMEYDSAFAQLKSKKLLDQLVSLAQDPYLFHFSSDDENACSLERYINGKGYHGLFRKSRACQNSNCYVSWPQC